MTTALTVAAAGFVVMFLSFSLAALNFGKTTVHNNLAKFDHNRHALCMIGMFGGSSTLVIGLVWAAIIFIQNNFLT